MSPSIQPEPEVSERVEGDQSGDEKIEDAVSASRLPRLIRTLVWCLIATLILMLAGCWILYSAAQNMPDFYRQAMSIDAQEAVEQGDEFERRLLDLQNTARSKEQWQAIFSEDQINGWLMSDFPEKFPDVLPPFVSDPQVGVKEDGVSLAFRYDTRRLSGIAHVEVDVFGTEEPGQIAIRIKQARSGFIPIPVASIANRVTGMMQRLNIVVTWSEIEGDPTALVDLPSNQFVLGDKSIELESVQLLDQQIVLSGSSIEKVPEE